MDFLYPPTSVLFAVGLGGVAGSAQRLQVLVIVCTAFSFRLDMIAESREWFSANGMHATAAQALLAQATIPLQDALP